MSRPAPAARWREEAAGIWRERLLRLPGFLVGANRSDPADWRDGLLLTGHFLARDAFGHQHRPLPAARVALLERVEFALCSESGCASRGNRLRHRGCLTT